MTESSDGKPISAYEKLISNLDYDNRVQRLAATEYLAGLDLAADPDIAQAADDFGNPALAAALGKLGAKKK